MLVDYGKNYWTPIAVNERSLKENSYKEIKSLGDIATQGVAELASERKKAAAIKATAAEELKSVTQSLTAVTKQLDEVVKENKQMKEKMELSSKSSPNIATRMVHTLPSNHSPGSNAVVPSTPFYL